ncbi:helix-turn-helix domain-containing protein [Arcanobacterium wilhelmae]|uniref:helix-turn-helix domain-containing protein n=1 Tax=Arcanobacterium wilhelmae TaxID=1803177 RepID=UPI003521F188
MDRTVLQNRRLEVARSLRHWRSIRGYTQSELADELGVPQSWVSNIESSARRLDVVEAEVICDVLGISISQLLDNRGSSK